MNDPHHEPAPAAVWRLAHLDSCAMGTTVRPEAGHDALIGRVLDDRYRIVARISRGGMATVYRATDSRLDRTVAIKIMHPGLAEDADFVSRFGREAKAAARLSHPNVVLVHDQGTLSDQGIPYLVMEYVDGRTLRDVLREHGPLTPEQALTILEPVLQALNAAHEAGFIHRDIKPENILISDNGRVKVADFGLARAVSSMTATQGLLIGTVAYLSPEHVETGTSDARSDVYGAGICLFEMLTGVVPFGGDSPITVAYQHVNADVPLPSERMAGITPAVDELVIRATRRNPDERYPDAQAFIDDLRQVRRGLPVPQPLAAPQATDDEHSTLVVPTEDSSDHTVDSAQAITSVVGRSNGPNDPAPTRSKRRRWPVLIGIVLLIAAIGGAAFAGWYLSLGPGRTVAVPGVVGLEVPAAQAIAAESDLSLVVGSEAFSETVAAGLIISTDPAPGADVRVQSEISAVVSLGPERFAVPDLAGLTTAQAEAALAEANLSLGDTRSVWNAQTPIDAVVRSNPKVGTELKADSAVNLILSKGPKPVTLSDYTGVDAQTVTAELQNAGLNVSINEDYSSSISLGSVISTSPGAGEKVEIGGTVTLLVSLGPPPVEVPFLIDLFREEAVAIIEGLGLVANVQEGPFTPLNRVINQDPSAGSMVPAGSTITITII